MGFDIGFYRFTDDHSKIEQMESLLDSSEEVFSSDEMAEMQKVAVAIAESSQGGSWGPLDGSMDRGAWADLPLIPDIAVFYRYVQISDWHPDTCDPDVLDCLRRLIAVLESHQYEAYDPQRGVFVRSKDYKW